MAVRDEAITTGAEKQGDVRKRTAGQAPQANGGYNAKDVQEKTKEKVCLLSLAYTVGSCLLGLERDALRLTAGFTFLVELCCRFLGRV